MPLETTALLYWFLRHVGYVVASIGYSALAFFSSALSFRLAAAERRIASLVRIEFRRQSGTVSYCVYLAHSTVLFGLHHLLLHRDPRVDDAERFIVTLLAGVATCALIVVSWRSRQYSPNSLKQCFEPCDLGAFGIPLWKMVYLKGRVRNSFPVPDISRNFHPLSFIASA